MIPGICSLHSLTFYYLFLVNQLIATFNLDTRLTPIKIGPKGSYFGFSVAQHYIGNGSLSDLEPV